MGDTTKNGAISFLLLLRTLLLHVVHVGGFCLLPGISPVESDGVS